MKNTFTLFSLCFIAFFNWSAFGQCPVPNSNFESWADGQPDGWFGIEATEVPGRNGGSAMQIDSIGFFPLVFPGVAATSFPCTQKSAYLNGYMKATVGSGDTIRVIAAFTLQNDTSAGAGGAGIITSNFASWTPFHVPVFTIAAGPVDTATISMFIKGLNSTVQFDDLAFSNTPIGQSIGILAPTRIQKPSFPKNALSFSMFPNPAAREIQIEAKSTSGTSEFTLLDMNGRVVLRKQWNQFTTSEKISLDGLKPGIYTARLTSRSAVVFKKLAIQ